MTKKRRRFVYDKRDAVALALNLCLVILEIKGMAIRISRHGSFGVEYYTQDSNFLMLIVAAMACFFILRKIIAKKDFPRWFSILKYAATLALLVTFLVVVCVLAPGIGFPKGYQLMVFTGAMYYTHFVCPILAVVCFCLFEKHDLNHKNDALLAISYTLLYAVVLLILNILRVVHGPYPFLMVYEQPIWASILWCITILGGAYVLALLLKYLRKRK